MTGLASWRGCGRAAVLVTLLGGMAAGCSQTQGQVCNPLSISTPFNDRCAPVVAAAPTPAPEAAAEAEPEPVPVEPKVVVKKGKIEILEKVEFETGSAALVEDPNSVLDEVVRVLEKNPDISLVRIEGHTDAQGGAAINRKLSQNRAKTVLAYLVNKGVSKSRLSAKGYGPDKPLESNDTAEGRERNRRVEFSVVTVCV